MQRVVVVPKYVPDIVMCNVLMSSSDFLQHGRKLHWFFSPLVICSRSPAPLGSPHGACELSLLDVCSYANQETRNATENTNASENCLLAGEHLQQGDCRYMGRRLGWVADREACEGALLVRPGML